MCVNRFDDETKTAMVDLYTKVDSGVNPDDVTPEDTTVVDGNEAPF
jgi:hypothetical protein